MSERQSPLLPVLLPVGLLALIVLVLFGVSRILLAVSHTAATVVALVALLVVLGVAVFVATRPHVGSASLFWMVSAVTGGVLAIGGVAVVAAPLIEEAEPQTVQLAAGPDATVEGFSPTELRVASEASIEMEFDNQEQGVQHNVVIFDGEDEAAPQLFGGSLITGPDSITYAVPALAEGSFFFHCEIHPTTMTGEIVAAPDAGDGEGGEGDGEGGGGGPVIAQGLKFNTDLIEVPAGEVSTVVLDNQDDGVPHNIAIYTDDSLADVLFQGELFPGIATQDYEVPALEEGEYFFQCDAHPDMRGSVVATPAAAGGGGEGGGGPPDDGGG